VILGKVGFVQENNTMHECDVQYIGRLSSSLGGSSNRGVASGGDRESEKIGGRVHFVYCFVSQFKCQQKESTHKRRFYVDMLKFGSWFLISSHDQFLVVIPPNRPHVLG
jgi:hypothetical protein